MATRAAAAKKAASSSRGVSDEHKAAMQAGRVEGAAVRRYLEALKAEQAPRRRGRRRTPEAIRDRIAAINAEVNENSDPIRELELRQERRNLQEDLAALDGPTIKSAEFEEGFVSAAKQFSERKGITLETWREMGVPVPLLRRAGVGR